MQLYPADLELFWHVKEWHCCSKYVEKLGIKMLFKKEKKTKTSTPEPKSCTEMKRSPGKLVEIHLTYSVLLFDQASVWGVGMESGFLLYQITFHVPSA